MKKNRYEEYIELMRIAYPNSTKKFERSKTQGVGVHVDTKSTFGRLNEYLQDSVISSLADQVASGKRRLKDREVDDFKINKRRV